MAMTPKQIRDARGDLTQVEFGVLVGVRGETVHRWEAGKYKPHAVFEQKIRELAKEKRGAA